MHEPLKPYAKWKKLDAKLHKFYDSFNIKYPEEGYYLWPETRFLSKER